MKQASTILLLPVLALLACGHGEGPVMLPGENCMNCHGGSAAKAVGAPAWTVAGTVYTAPDAEMDTGTEGALVHLTDALNLSLTLKSNAVGNFYTREPLVFPLRACVEYAGFTRCMETVPRGSCNECHTIPSQNQAPGRITAGP